MKQREPELAAQVERTITALEGHLNLMTASPGAAIGSLDVHTSAAMALRTWAEARAAHAGNLLSAEDPEQLAKMRHELAELDARQLLSSRLGTVRAWQESLRRIRKLDKVRTALATNKITTKQRQLAESQLTESLKKALAVELSRLQCSDLPVEIEMQTALAQP